MYVLSDTLCSALSWGSIQPSIVEIGEQNYWSCPLLVSTGIRNVCKIADTI